MIGNIDRYKYVLLLLATQIPHQSIVVQHSIFLYRWQCQVAQQNTQNALFRFHCNNGKANPLNVTLHVQVMGYGMHDQRPVVTFSTLALCFISMQPERHHTANCSTGRLRLKSDDTRVENRFRLSAKRTSPFKSAGASVQSTTGSRGVRISGSNAGYIMFRGSVKSTG